VVRRAREAALSGNEEEHAQVGQAQRRLPRQNSGRGLCVRSDTFTSCHDSPTNEKGGGGLIAGVAVALRSTRPSVRIIGVEPEGAAKLTRSLEAGSAVTLQTASSIADGLLPVRLGDLTFAHAREYVDEVVTVDDSVTRRAVEWLFRHARLVAEPSGAITTAALMLGLGDAASRGSVVAIVSGGNVEPGRYAEYVAHVASERLEVV
jgi:threonine dehydratase